MADETATATSSETNATTSTEEKATTGTATDPAAELDKWKSLARKNEQQAKANAAAAKKLAEIEEASKSEADKAAERLTAAEKRAADAEVQVLRLQVAGEKGLTPSQAKRLVGSTREELEADADELLATFGGAQQKNGSTNGESKNVRPKTAMRTVPVTDGGEAKDTNAQMNDWLRAAARK